MMKAALASFLALAFITTSTAADNELDRERRLAGKTRWIAASIGMCPFPNATLIGSKQCRTLARGTRITIIDAQRGQKDSYGPGGIWFFMRLGDGSSGFIPAIHGGLTDLDPRPTSGKSSDPCRNKGMPAIGMTAAQVRATCVGEPRRRNRTVTAAGTSEIWIYTTWDMALVLENGIVTVIHDRR